MRYDFQNDQVPRDRVTVMGTLGRNYTVFYNVYKYLLIESHWQWVSVWSVIAIDDLRTSVTRLG